MIVEYIITLSIVFIVTRYIVGRLTGKEHRLPPSLPCLPIVGSLPFLRKLNNIPEFFMDKSHELGPIFTFRVGNKLVLTLNTKEVIDEAFVKNSRSFSSRPGFFMAKRVNPNNKGIIFMNTTQEWKRIHQLSLLILKEFGFGDKGIMEERILREVETMIEFVKEKRERPIASREVSVMLTSNIMTSFLFGFRRDYAFGISELILTLDRAAHLSTMTFDVAPFLQYVPRFRDRITEYQDCSKRIYHMQNDEIDKCQQSQDDCFVSQYIQKEGTNYDQEQLNFILRDLTAAGTDTTANTLQWGFIALANHPETQKKLQREVDSVLSRDRLPTLQDQSKLPYVEATILELYRWRTLVPLSVARQTSGDSVLGGFFIPAKTLVLPNLFSAHSDPRVWKDPDSFQPERFLDKDNNVIGKDRVIPFSLGRRSCLGEILARAEIFLILTSLIQRFTILPPERQDRVYDKFHLPVALLSMPEEFSIRLVERH